MCLSTPKPSEAAAHEKAPPGQRRRLPMIRTFDSASGVNPRSEAWFRGLERRWGAAPAGLHVSKGALTASCALARSSPDVPRIFDLHPRGAPPRAIGRALRFVMTPCRPSRLAAVRSKTGTGGFRWERPLWRLAMFLRLWKRLGGKPPRRMSKLGPRSKLVLGSGPIKALRAWPFRDSRSLWRAR
jgi:hypothetical protein